MVYSRNKRKENRQCRRLERQRWHIYIPRQLSSHKAELRYTLPMPIKLYVEVLEPQFTPSQASVKRIEFQNVSSGTMV